MINVYVISQFNFVAYCMLISSNDNTKVKKKKKLPSVKKRDRRNCNSEDRFRDMGSCPSVFHERQKSGSLHGTLKAEKGQ